MNQINVIELNNLLEEKKITLIDVREDFEIQICSIKGSVFIPMSQIPASIDTLNSETSYAVICHSGIRSMSVTNFLINHNFNAVNVIGGINEWAISIDPTMKQY